MIEIETTVSKLLDVLVLCSGAKFVITVLSGLLPFGHNNQGLHRGRVNDTTGDTIKNFIPGDSFWLLSVLQYDQAI